MRFRTSALVLLVATIAAASTGKAQDPNTVLPASNLPATLNVYLDCQGMCDFDFVRTEVPYVNWVRDQADADVHLLVTFQSTGGGGIEFVLNFIGQRGFAQMLDTLKYVSSGDATSDDRRKGYTRTIKAGLVRYLARTSAAGRLEVSMTPATATASAAAKSQRDPWKAWVFSISANGNTDGEHSYKSMRGNLNLNGNRTTAAFKSIIGGNFQYSQSDVLVEMGNTAGTADTTYTTIRRSWRTNTQQIKSLTEHWSAGFTANLGSNTYSNQRLYSRANLAAEYDLFPYKESTRRQLRIQYGAGFSDYRYVDTTIYFKIRETIPTHYASVSLSARQPWGSSNIDLSHNAQILDPAKRSTELYGYTDIRIFKGLRFNVGGGYSWIHDQLFLKKAGASDVEVFLRQHQLGTSYSYYMFGGLSYTFGSIFNNVVNPRFGGSDFF